MPAGPGRQVAPGGVRPDPMSNPGSGPDGLSVTRVGEPSPIGVCPRTGCAAPPRRHERGAPPTVPTRGKRSASATVAAVSPIAVRRRGPRRMIWDTRVNSRCRGRRARGGSTVFHAPGSRLRTSTGESDEETTMHEQVRVTSPRLAVCTATTSRDTSAPTRRRFGRGRRRAELGLRPAAADGRVHTCERAAKGAAEV